MALENFRPGRTHVHPADSPLCVRPDEGKVTFVTVSPFLPPEPKRRGQAMIIWKFKLLRQPFKIIALQSILECAIKSLGTYLLM